MRIVIALLMVASASACAASTKAPEIERSERTVDLSGEWNDIDADLVANEMIQDCLKSPWLDPWIAEHQGRHPSLLLVPVKNKTAGYINYKYFTKQIEQALIRSGKIDVLSNPDDAVSPDDAPPPPKSDLILNGVILSQDDAAGNQEVRAYLTSIEIVDTASQKKAWAGQKRIRKLITRER